MVYYCNKVDNQVRLKEYYYLKCRNGFVSELKKLNVLEQPEMRANLCYRK